ncbi:hypothetical protein FIBSPDRAFT_896479 [Athelia psychrophila]|uniref:Uncharacterized protein n=1 Tax=Athelia psychrophila TaxID=1759441 RepID=A0A166DDW8_9AGAM|nr:hypothetical protein FIBSPDRAFT_896479 [Fibularhizoctonia sp. CBS 109695]
MARPKVLPTLEKFAKSGASSSATAMGLRLGEGLGEGCDDLRRIAHAPSPTPGAPPIFVHLVGPWIPLRPPPFLPSHDVRTCAESWGAVPRGPGRRQAAKGPTQKGVVFVVDRVRVHGIPPSKAYHIARGSHERVKGDTQQAGWCTGAIPGDGRRGDEASMKDSGAAMDSGTSRTGGWALPRKFEVGRNPAIHMRQPWPVTAFSRRGPLVAELSPSPGASVTAQPREKEAQELLMICEARKTGKIIRQGCGGTYHGDHAGHRSELKWELTLSAYVMRTLLDYTTPTARRKSLWNGARHSLAHEKKEDNRVHTGTQQLKLSDSNMLSMAQEHRDIAGGIVNIGRDTSSEARRSVYPQIMIILSCACKQAGNWTRQTNHDPALPSKLYNAFEGRMQVSPDDEKVQYEVNRDCDSDEDSEKRGA